MMREVFVRIIATSKRKIKEVIPAEQYIVRSGNLAIAAISINIRNFA